MPWSLVGVYGLLPAFLLVLFRVGGLVLATPLFSGSAIPMKIKAFLTIAISLAIFPMMASQLPQSVTMLSAVVGLIGELAIGLFIGLGVALIFMGFQLAAQLIGQQSGMGVGAVFNPMMETSSTSVEQLYYFLVMMLFISVGGDHAVVRSLLDSFYTIPPLAFSMDWPVAEMLMDITSTSLAVSIRVGGPTVLALLMAFLILGFLSRTIPQLNILSVGFPLKLGVGLVVIAITLTALETVLVEALDDCFDAIRIGLGIAETA